MPFKEKVGLTEKSVLTFRNSKVRGVKFFYKAEYCGTPQSKERRNGEYKVCLNERALRLLDQDVTWKLGCFLASGRGDLKHI